MLTALRGPTWHCAMRSYQHSTVPCNRQLVHSASDNHNHKYNDHDFGVSLDAKSCQSLALSR